MIAADPGSVGEGITINLRREHLFAPRAFTSLKVNQAIVKAFDGVRVLEPWVVYLRPMHENPEVSWFETTGKVGDDTGAGRRRRFFLDRLLGIQKEPGADKSPEPPPSAPAEEGHTPQE